MDNIIVKNNEMTLIYILHSRSYRKMMIWNRELFKDITFFLSPA